MKKTLVSGALGLAMLGAAAVPAQSAFGISPQRKAERCSVLIQTIQILRAQRAEATDPFVIAAINQGGQKLVDKAHRLGCHVPPPTP
jgi:hypothetical protein